MKIKTSIKFFLLLFSLIGLLYPNYILAFPGAPCLSNSDCASNEVCGEPTVSQDGGESSGECVVVASGERSAGSSPTGGEELGPRVAATLNNPLGDDTTNVPTVIGRVIQVLLGVLGSLALFVFCLGAFNWVTSAGYPQRIEEGTKTMLFAVAGMFVIFAAYGILSAILRVLEVGE